MVLWSHPGPRAGFLFLVKRLVAAHQVAVATLPSLRTPKRAAEVPWVGMVVAWVGKALAVAEPFDAEEDEEEGNEAWQGLVSNREPSEEEKRNEPIATKRTTARGKSLFDGWRKEVECCSCCVTDVAGRTPDDEEAEGDRGEARVEEGDVVEGEERITLEEAMEADAELSSRFARVDTLMLGVETIAEEEDARECVAMLTGTTAADEEEGGLTTAGLELGEANTPGMTAEVGSTTPGAAL